jgi:hypothetical protein
MAARQQRLAQFRQVESEWLKKDQARRVRLRELAGMPYEEYLQTPEWRDMSRDIKARVGRCEWCGSADCLNVHHKTYQNRGREKRGDLLVLCRSCHADLHDKEVA